MSFTRRLGWVGLLALAFALRLPGLFANSFHADEALYASWARLIHAGHDPLLQMVLVDKPPLLFYLQAAFFPLFGPLEWAARLPNFIASLALVPLTGRLAYQLYGKEAAAWGAAVVAACSPFLVQFSPTAFTDPLMVTLAVAALVLLLNGRPAWSGLFWGLSLAAKHQALFFLPLLLYLWRPTTNDERPTFSSFVVGRWSFLSGAAVPLALLLIWEWMQGGANTFTAALLNFGGLRLAWSWELWPRLTAWAKMLPLLISAPWAVAALVFLLVSRQSSVLLPSSFFLRPSSFVPRPSSFVPLPSSLVLFSLAYLLFHWLTAVPVWDRFLLPLAPLTAVLVGSLWTRISRINGSNKSVNPANPCSNSRFAILLFLVLLPGAIMAADGRYPLGGTRDADQGAAQISQFLANEPYGTVLYDHWYGWQWRYHLFDSRVYVSWFAHPQGLADDLTAFFDDDHARYLVVTAGNGRLPVERAIYDNGFMLELVCTAVNPDGQPTMLLYRVTR
jgi:4-amino-4-deoxy-L-arabinose transferase-like glycosyltransferase